jgi:hypothetical protein
MPALPQSWTSALPHCLSPPLVNTGVTYRDDDHMVSLGAPRVLFVLFGPPLLICGTLLPTSASQAHLLPRSLLPNPHSQILSSIPPYPISFLHNSVPPPCSSTPPHSSIPHFPVSHCHPSPSYPRAFQPCPSPALTPHAAPHSCLGCRLHLPIRSWHNALPQAIPGRP